MIYNLGDFQEATFSKCQYPQDDIILVDGSIIILDGIDIVPFLSYVNGHTKKISISRVCYYYKLNTKFISLYILNRKELIYSS